MTSSCSSHSSDQHACHSGGAWYQDRFFMILLVAIFALLVISFGISTGQADVTAIPTWLQHMSFAMRELGAEMWGGVLLGLVLVGLMQVLPQSVFDKILGTRDQQKGMGGLWRACLAGLVLDLCSHGILLVGIQFYRRGASLAQLLTFLIASPWNSLSLTVILASLIGIPWTIAFVLLSAVVAMLAGILVQAYCKDAPYFYAPQNQKEAALPQSACCHEKPEPLMPSMPAGSFSWRGLWQDMRPHFWQKFFHGVTESVPILRWLLLGILLSVLIKVFVPHEWFTGYFGPSLMGLGLTLVVATVIELCSEGSVPIAADLFTRAAAKGNAFAFLMTGVATDYTEIFALRQATGSWRGALILPLLTVPQIILLSWAINQF